MFPSAVDDDGTIKIGALAVGVSLAENRFSRFPSINQLWCICLDVRVVTFCQLMGFPKPLKVKLLAGEQKATESSRISSYRPGNFLA